MYDQEINQRITNNNDIAFTAVVLAAYFTAFANIKEISAANILILLFLAIIFIVSGTYGFKVIQELNDLTFKYWYLGSQILIGSVIVYFIGGAGFSALILIPIAAHAVTLLDIRWSAIPIVISILLYAFVVWLYSHSIDAVVQSTTILVAGMIFITAFTQLTVNESRSRRRAEKLLKELIVANEQLVKNAEEMKEMAIVEERNRIAHEIHDGLGHYLTTINMELQSASAVRKNSPEKADEMLKNAMRLTKNALSDVRESVFAFNNPIHESILLGEIAKDIIRSQGSGAFEIKSKIDPSLETSNTKVKWAVYRILQEAFNNIKRHANATFVICNLYKSGNDINIEIQNDGVESPVYQEGFGLLGIRERIAALNGEAEITQTENKFMLKVRIPNE